MGRILQTCYGIKGRTNQLARMMLADKLIAEGERLINLAAETKTFHNRTKNLINSFGSTLYIDGKEYTGPADFYNHWAKGSNGKWSIRSGFAPGTTELQKRQGSDYSRRYAKERNPMASPFDARGNISRKDPNYPGYYAEKWDGALAIDNFFDHYEAPQGKWQLVVVEALFYGGILEKKYSIKVISQIEGEMRTLASQLHGTILTHDGYKAGQ